MINDALSDARNTFDTNVLGTLLSMKHEMRVMLMVLSGFQVRPSAHVDVAVRSHAEVGPVNMRMRSVSMNRIAGPETRGHFGTVLVKAVDRNGAGYSLNPRFREVDLIAYRGSCGLSRSIPCGRGRIQSVCRAARAISKSSFRWKAHPMGSCSNRRS